jgi:3-deoxy-manno-octulosonate cytidylyltransferase (CMP-KDO synthetase)
VKIAAVIPARYASTRFPGKPLVNISGKPMIQWVHSALSRNKALDKLIVATDDERIFNACEDFGADVVMTSPDHKSGTDRISEVAKELDVDYVINIQGDEPLVDDKIIDELVEVVTKSPEIKMGSLARELGADEVSDPNVVKVWIDSNNHAIYFARTTDGDHKYYAHIGAYIYKRDFLLEFTSLNPTKAEGELKLEQLRALDNGHKIGIGLVDHHSIGVDTEDDLAKVESILSDRPREEI